MHTLPASAVPASDIDQLEAAIVGLRDNSPLGEFLLRASAALRGGTSIAFAPLEEPLTPSDAARILCMSRTHFYKLLDSGDVPSFSVGRDRRVRFSDVVAYNESRASDRAALAERFARFDQGRDALQRGLG